MNNVIRESVAECIGNTPVIELHDDLVPAGKRLLLKLEYYNPSFSIKDRTALGLIKAAMKAGKLLKGGTLIESTSGNLGKSLAMLGAVYGFNVIVVIDAKTSSTVIRWCEAYGAKMEMVRETDENGGYQKTRVARVKKLLEEIPGSIWLNQYDNPDNPEFHYATTGEEVAELSIEAVVGTVSTGGHLCGISRKVKQMRPGTVVIACDVEGSSVFGGPFHPYLVNGSGLSWRCKNTDLAALDKICILSDQEAISICRLLAREGGLLFGGSAGLAVCGSLAWLKQSTVKSVLGIIPDTGANYLDQIYNDAWLSDRGIKLLSRRELEEHLETRAVIDVDEYCGRQQLATEPEAYAAAGD